MPEPISAQDARRELADEDKKSRAHSAINNAIKTGRLSRPSSCEQCGVTPAKAKDGRSQVQGHHFLGYDHPLSVRWLCVKCHRKETPVARGRKNGWHTTPESRTYGSKNGIAKLTEEIARRIYLDKRPSRFVAAEHGISTWNVRSIRRGEAWRTATLTVRGGRHG